MDCPRLVLGGGAGASTTSTRATPLRSQRRAGSVGGGKAWRGLLERGQGREDPCGEGGKRARNDGCRAWSTIARARAGRGVGEVPSLEIACGMPGHASRGLCAGSPGHANPSSCRPTVPDGGPGAGGSRHPSSCGCGQCPCHRGGQRPLRPGGAVALGLRVRCHGRTGGRAGSRTASPAGRRGGPAPGEATAGPVAEPAGGSAGLAPRAPPGGRGTARAVCAASGRGCARACGVLLDPPRPGPGCARGRAAWASEQPGDGSRGCATGRKPGQHEGTLRCHGPVPGIPRARGGGGAAGGGPR